MYASIQRYDHVTAPAEAVMPVGRELAAALQRVRGFIAYVLLDAGDGQLIAVSLFEDEVDLRAAAEVTAPGDWLHGMHSRQAAAPSIVSGEVVVQRGL